MVDIQALETVRLNIRKNLPLLAQGEVFVNLFWLCDNKNGIKTTFEDYELAYLTEAWNNWQGKTYTSNNIKAHLKPDSPNYNRVNEVFDNLNNLKNKGEWITAIDWFNNQYKQGTRAVAQIYTEFYDKIDELKKKQSQPSKGTELDGKLVDEWNVDFSADFGKQITPESLKAVKTKLIEKDKSIVDLKADNEKKDTIISGLQRDVEEKDDIIPKRNETISVLTTELEKRNKTIGERDEDFINLTTKLKEEKSKLTKLAEEWKLDFLKDFGDNLNVDSLKSVKEALDRLGDDNETLKEANSNLQKDIADKVNTITKLTADLADRDSTINQLKAVVEGSKDLPDKIKELINQLGDKDAELTQKNETINTLANERDALKIDKAQLEADKAKAEKERNDLQLEKDKLRAKWDTDFKEFGGELTVENLAGLKVILGALTTDNADFFKIRAVWDSNFKEEFGELTPDSLVKVWEKLAELDKKIAAKASEIESLKTQLSEQEKTISEKNKTIADLTEKLLKPKRDEIKHELTNFFQDMDIDDGAISQKYESNENWKKLYGEQFDHETIINTRLTLDNEESMKQAFKVVTCICATEIFKELRDEIAKDSPTLPDRLLLLLEGAKKGWDEVGEYQPINQENNPFYLDLIEEKWQEYKKEVDDLINTYKLQNLQVQPPK